MVPWVALSSFSMDETVDETSTASWDSITHVSAISVVVREPDRFLSRPPLCTSKWSFRAIPRDVSVL